MLRGIQRVLLLLALVFHVLDLLQVQYRVPQFHIGRGEHEVKLAAVLTEEEPVGCDPAELVFHHEFIRVDQVIQISFESLR